MAERRYSDEEVALILRRAVDPAADGSEGEQGRGLTLAELKEIGTEAGIDATRIETAAGSLTLRRPRPVTGVVLGMPTTVQLDRRVSAPLTRERLPELLNLIRTEFARQGIVEEVLGGFEWRARSAMGGRYVSIRPEGNGTRIRVLGNYRDGMLGLGAGVGPVAAAATGALTAALGAATALVVVPAALAGGVLAALGPWKYAFGREERTLQRVLDGLVAQLSDGGMSDDGRSDGGPATGD